MHTLPSLYSPSTTASTIPSQIRNTLPQDVATVDGEATRCCGHITTLRLTFQPQQGRVGLIFDSWRCFTC
ncbi:hypothetical protein TSUD_18480 [Trifolium subterraneum]|uniref:Uncharacterized protein n=1 Tax=Trifolium subterraneum TaxID=3900 RepID=A0A2Z6MFC5_TRISU|nr:hypothetical protein TSUD_18480 [Trifolium subterraneum]